MLGHAVSSVAPVNSVFECVNMRKPKRSLGNLGTGALTILNGSRMFTRFD